MENLLLYLLVCLAVIFLLASLETLTKDFKYIAKDIMQAIKPVKISMNDISGKPNQKKTT
jgi:ABC-type polysaccharide/polyol phosphate export permease